MAFGRLIAVRRREVGLSQSQLAVEVCVKTGRTTVTRHEISRYEHGTRRPTGAMLAALAGALDLPLPLLRRAIAEDRVRTMGAALGEKLGPARGAKSDG